MKKISSIILIGFIILGLVGCRNKEEINIDKENISSSYNEEISDEDEAFNSILYDNWDEIVENKSNYDGLTLEEGVRKDFENPIIDLSQIQNSQLLIISITKDSEKNIDKIRKDCNEIMKRESKLLKDNGVTKVHIEIYDNNDYLMDTNSYELYNDTFEWMGHW